MLENKELNSAVVRLFNNLLAFEYVAIDGYKAAIEGFEKDYPGIAAKTREFLGDHERHVRELTQQVCDCGEEPRSLPGADVVFKKPFMQIRKMQGGEALLGAMVSNEESASMQYDSAVMEARN